MTTPTPASAATADLRVTTTASPVGELRIVVSALGVRAILSKPLAAAEIVMALEAA